MYQKPLSGLGRVKAEAKAKAERQAEQDRARNARESMARVAAKATK